VADFDGDQALALQLESLTRNRPVDNGTRGNLTGEVDVPHLGSPRGGLLVHFRNRAFGGICYGAWETLQQLVGAEPMVAMPVSGIDVGQRLAGLLDPVANPLHLITGEGRVD